MKRFFMIFLLGLIVSGGVFGAQTVGKLSGTVRSDKGDKVAYATIILMKQDSVQVAGTVSDEEGRWAIPAPEGDYLLKVTCMGYEGTEREVVLRGTTEVDDIVLTESATAIEGVVVRTKLITREADRFVVNVSGSNTAIGKDTYEMIGISPGVRADEDGIKINGRSGARVMIGERLLNMSGDELISYLRSIPAENVQKIEVIPMAGADYDADSSGGIIKITLKRQRNDGVDGTLSLAGYMPVESKYDYWFWQPSFRVNYQKDRLNLYTSGSYSKYDGTIDVFDRIERFDENNELISTVNSASRMREVNEPYRLSLGAVYDLNSRHSVGGEVNFYTKDDMSRTIADSRQQFPTLATNNTVDNKSDYENYGNGGSLSATLNYIAKLDTLGSTFKLIADYSHSDSDSHYLESNEATVGTLAPVTEYRRLLGDSEFNIYALTANVEKKLSPRSSVRYGGKISYNTVFDRMDYYNSTVGEPYDWVFDDNMTNPPTDYNESVGALYFIYNNSWKRLSLSAGLRGEYTWLENKNGGVKQNYFDLFPNATLSYALNDRSSNMLIAQYSRNIYRPSFSVLNNYQVRISEYTTVIGNPNLTPQYSSNLSLTYVLNYKYTFSLVGQFVRDVIQQQMFTQPDSDVIYYQHVNSAEQNSYGVSMSLPFEVTKWFSFNYDLQMLQMDTKSEFANSSCLYTSMDANMNFTLPRNFFFEVNGWWMSKVEIGTLMQLPMGDFDVAIKKRLKNNKMTLSLGVDNLLNNPGRIRSQGEGFKESLHQMNQPRIVRASVNYNFNAGKKFTRRTVETGAAEEKSRM
ncbi:MAG: TonB-dependent receptor [Tidjanibacter sp.]|nr:TonB-dependent receptor [Tidjanibacter sp.]